jgi:hypothetical protein
MFTSSTVQPSAVAIRPANALPSSSNFPEAKWRQRFKERFADKKIVLLIDKGSIPKIELLDVIMDNLTNTLEKLHQG